MSFKAIPYTPNRMTLDQMTIALLTTNGVHRKDQLPFSDQRSIADLSYRMIGKDAAANDLTLTHAATLERFDPRDAKKDINVVFPIDRLRELAAEGVLGGVARCHYSLMGYMMRYNPLREHTLTELIKKIIRSDTDAVLLTAACPYSNRTAVVLQRAIEEQGVPTVLIAMDIEKAGMYRPPRAIHPKNFSKNHVLGKPFDTETQREVLLAALHQLNLQQEPGKIHELEFPTYFEFPAHIQK